jgi:hypothetical protein
MAQSSSVLILVHDGIEPPNAGGRLRGIALPIKPHSTDPIKRNVERKIFPIGSMPPVISTASRAGGEFSVSSGGP